MNTPVLTSECWIWHGAKNSEGYPQKRHNGRTAYVHRLSYEKAYGPIPVGLELDHLCRTPPCYNPNHLEAVTHGENLRRGKGNQYIGRETCSKGHRYSPENTRIYTPINGRPFRLCRECERIREHQRRRS